MSKLYFFTLLFLATSAELTFFLIDLTNAGMEVFVFVFLFLIPLSLLHLNAAEARIQNKNLKNIAQKIGIKYIPPKINSFFYQGIAYAEGELGNQRLQIKIKNLEGHTYTEILLYLNHSIKCNFTLTKIDSYLSKSGPRINPLDIQHLAKEFAIQFDDEVLTSRILDSESQRYLLRIKRMFKGYLELKNNSLVYLQRRKLTKDEYCNFLIEIIKLMCAVPHEICLPSDKLNEFGGTFHARTQKI